MTVNYNALAAWAAVVAALAAVVAVILEGRRSRFSLGIDLIFRLDERWASEEMVTARRMAAQSLLHKGPDTGADDVINFFATVGILLRKRALDEEMVWATFFWWFVRYWQAAESYIAAARKADPTIWSSVEFLRSALLKMELSKRHCTEAQTVPSAPEIETFLREESTLSGGARLSLRRKAVAGREPS